MKVKELIERLSKQKPNNEVVVFAEGKLYPVFDVAHHVDRERTTELGCGWAELDDGEDDGGEDEDEIGACS
jgi:hypothetical protein